MSDPFVISGQGAYLFECRYSLMGYQLILMH